jgi:hypothetical protein
VGLEPTRRKAQVPKTCVSAVSPLPLEYWNWSRLVID